MATKPRKALKLPAKPQPKGPRRGHARTATLAKTLPKGYTGFLSDLRDRIRTAQVKASLSVNRELIELYWHIGRSIVERQETERWGNSVVDRLAGDIQKSFPGIPGISPRNIWRMRAFYLAWSEAIPSQAAAELGNPILSQGASEAPGPILSQAATDLKLREVPPPVARIPWFHNVVLVEQLKDPVQRLWYAQQTTAQGWSRAVLVHQIESDLYHRCGKAVTNFAATIPAPESDLAQQLIKDPYNFDFLTLAGDAQERDLERGLIEHLKKFLIELGVGFAFVGQQYHIEVGAKDFYLDLLFYHLRSLPSPAELVRELATPRRSTKPNKSNSLTKV